MEEKLLKAKELKELLAVLAKMGNVMHTFPDVDGGVSLTITSIINLGSTLHIESFHNYADDPQKCILSFLHNFFSLPTTAEHISSPQN